MTNDKYFVQFHDVDGVSVISSFASVDCWSASQGTDDVMLFSFQEALKVRDELETHPRYEGHPDEGFFRLTVNKATDIMYSNWCGPSGELIGYLSEGNTKEDLVRLMWEHLTLEQREALEQEASQFMEEFSQYMEGAD